MHAVGTVGHVSLNNDSIPTRREIVTMMIEAVKEMSPATIWLNHNERHLYEKPSDEDLKQAQKFESLRRVIIPTKTKDGRFFYLCCENYRYFLEQRDEKGFRSDEIANHYGSSLEINIFLDELKQIEDAIKSKLTLK